MKLAAVVKQDKKTGEVFIDIKIFKDLFDITKIKAYSLEVNPDKTLSLTFFDENNKKLKPKKA